MKRKYESDDGKIFDTEEEALKHDFLLTKIKQISFELSDSGYNPICSDCSCDAQPNVDDYDDISELIVLKWEELVKIMNSGQIKPPVSTTPTNEELSLEEAMGLPKEARLYTDKEVEDIQNHNYDGFQVRHCSICGSTQFMSESEITCHNGHGGAPSK
jgi:hypothetical protein